jgi:TIR domain
MRLCRKTHELAGRRFEACCLPFWQEGERKMENAHYDVFISYSSKDWVWAQQLEKDLRDKGFSPFLDQKRLKAGDIWAEELIGALQQSHHLIVLWSEHAKKSDWVLEEYTRFDQSRRVTQRPGRIITILLEGENRRFNSYQQIKDLQTIGAYNSGFDALDKNVWRSVLTRVEEALRVDENALSIPLAIITTTRERLEKLDPFEGPQDGIESLNDVLKRLSMGTRDDLLQYYGDTRREWKPFGDTKETILTIMERLRDQINQKSQDDKIRWKLMDDVFWSINQEDVEIVDREAENFLPQPLDAKQFAVIIIDPISFCDRLVESRFNSHIYRCLQNINCLVMILPPFPISTPNHGLRYFLSRRLNTIYNNFYNPVEHSLAATNWNLYISEERDIQRFLFWALKSQDPHKESSKSPSPLLKMGGRF